MNYVELMTYLRAIEFRRPDGPYNWDVDTDALPTLRFRLSYYEVDTDESNYHNPVELQLELQLGRWWYVEQDWGFDEVIKAAWLAITVSDEHRRREWFTVNGEAIFNPHRSLTQ